jgi:hypothetical protein
MNRKAKRIGLWVVSAILLPIVLYVGYGVGSLFVYLPIQNAIWRSRIFNADKIELLIACRQMISNCDKYTNEVDGTSSRLRDGQKELDLWDWNKNAPRAVSPPLPPAIEYFRPSYLVIGTNHLILQPHYPTRTRIIAYSENTVPFPLFTGTMTTLTNGLYFKDLNSGL